MSIRTALVYAAIVAAGAACARADTQARPSIDRAGLLSDLRTLSADDMEGRELGTAGGGRARAYVEARIQAAGVLPFGKTYDEPFPFSLRASAPSREGTGVNVVGYLDGTSDRTHFLVVSAHYDHLGVKNGVVFNGADDNASGTAGLIALAAYFHAHRTQHSLLFVAFDGEEEGLLGSKAFLASPPVDRSRLLVDLNADMIGRDPNNTLFVVGARAQPALRPYVDAVARTAPVKLVAGHDNPLDRSVEDWTQDSDHYSFMLAGIPALYFGVEDYGQHHKATDDYETMTPDFYVRAVETLVAVVDEFDAHADQIRPR